MDEIIQEILSDDDILIDEGNLAGKNDNTSEDKVSNPENSITYNSEGCAVVDGKELYNINTEFRDIVTDISGYEEDEQNLAERTTVVLVIDIPNDIHQNAEYSISQQKNIAIE